MSFDLREIDRTLKENADLAASFERHKNSIQHAVVDPNHPETLVVATANGFIQTVALEKGSFKLHLVHLGGTPLEAPLRCFDVSPGLYVSNMEHVSVLFSLSHSNELLWGDISTGRVRSFGKFRARPSAIFADGDHIVSGDASGALKLWRSTISSTDGSPSAHGFEVDPSFLAWDRQVHGAAITAININRDIITVTAEDYAVKVLSVATGEPLAALINEATRIPALVGLPPPTDQVVLCSQKGSITFYYPTSAARTEWHPHKLMNSFPVSCVAYTNGFLAVGGSGGRVALYDISREAGVGRQDESDDESDPSNKDEPLVCFDLGHRIAHASVTLDSFFLVVTEAGDVWRWPLKDVLPAVAEVAAASTGASNNGSVEVDMTDSVGARRILEESTTTTSGPGEQSQQDTAAPSSGSNNNSSSDDNPTPAPQSMTPRPTTATSSRSPSERVAASSAVVGSPAPVFQHEGATCVDGHVATTRRSGSAEVSVAVPSHFGVDDEGLDESAGVEFGGADVSSGRRDHPQPPPAASSPPPTGFGAATVIYMDDDSDNDHYMSAAAAAAAAPSSAVSNNNRYAEVPTPPMEPHSCEVLSTTTAGSNLPPHQPHQQRRPHHHTDDGVASSVGMASSNIPSTVQLASHNQTRFVNQHPQQSHDMSSSEVAPAGGRGGAERGDLHRCHRRVDPSQLGGEGGTGAIQQSDNQQHHHRVPQDEVTTMSVHIPGLKAGRRMDPREARATVERAAKKDNANRGPSHELSVAQDNSTLALVAPSSPREHMNNHSAASDRSSALAAAAAVAVAAGDVSYVSEATGAFDAKKYAEDHKPLAQALEYRYSIPAHNYARDEAMFSAVGLTEPAGGEKSVLDGPTPQQRRPPSSSPSSVLRDTSNMINDSEASAAAAAAQSSAQSMATNNKIDKLMDATYTNFVRKKNENFEKQRAKPGPDIHSHLCHDILFPFSSAASSTSSAARGGRGGASQQQAGSVFFAEHAPALPPPQPLVLPLPIPPTPSTF